VDRVGGLGTTANGAPWPPPKLPKVPKYTFVRNVFSRRLLAAMADRLSLEQRLAELAAAARTTAQSLPPGEERDAMLLRAHQCDVAAVGSGAAFTEIEHSHAQEALGAHGKLKEAAGDQPDGLIAIKASCDALASKGG
jgi:hypothetical protein